MNVVKQIRFLFILILKHLFCRYNKNRQQSLSSKFSVHPHYFHYLQIPNPFSTLLHVNPAQQQHVKEPPQPTEVQYFSYSFGLSTATWDLNLCHDQ